MSQPILAAFRRLQGIPGGSLVFDAGVAFTAPFNASVAPRVRELKPGRAVVEMKDRPWRRNHVGSLHAMALGALAEITANLALLASLPEGARMIPTGFQIEFAKKARGAVVAVSTFDCGALDARPGSIELPVEIADGAGDIVARTRQICRIRWSV